MARSPSRSAATPGAEPERWRVFLAIELPDAVRAKLQGQLDDLLPLADYLRINPVERMHLTLHFLGHLPVTDAKRLPLLIEPVVERHRSFEVTVQGVGGFPNLARAQVLWAGIVGTEVPRLMALQSQLGTALRDAGLTAEERFHPHLTLARVRRPLKGGQRKLLTDWQARWKEPVLGTVPVTEVCLMRSQLGSGPPRYTTLSTFELQ
jgi:RNA 2',3'-cyclic 3'-phosphodiesterase